MRETLEDGSRSLRKASLSLPRNVAKIIYALMWRRTIRTFSAMSGKSLRLTFKGDKVRVLLTQPKRKRVKRSEAPTQNAFYQDEESDAEMYGGDEQGRFRYI